MRRAVLAVALVLAAPAPAALDGPALSPEKPAPVAPGPPGELVVVPGKGSTRPGGARVLRYAVEVEGALRIERRAFAAAVEGVLTDPRGWAGAGLAFRRVSSGPVDLRVALASPSLTDRLCAPLPTNGIFSCASGNRAVLNVFRWKGGAGAYRGRLDRYRDYMINHEVGHVLGNGHAWCPAAGARAPVMLQQTKGLAGCRPNPWPLAWERR
jgi:Protein of unknown function (DUF3152)